MGVTLVVQDHQDETLMGKGPTDSVVGERGPTGVPGD